MTSKPKTSRRSTAKSIGSRSRKVCKLPENIRIQEAEALHSKLTSLLTATNISFDASAVKKIDCSGLQILTAFCLCAADKNIGITWKNPSEQLLAAANLLNIDDKLNISGNTRQPGI